MAFRLDGKIALITGSSTGLGKEIAFRLGEAGAHVIMNYSNNIARAETAFREYEAAGHKGTLIRASAVDANEIEKMVDFVETQLGPIDIIVPNATPAQPQKPIEEYDWTLYQSMLDFFIKSPFLLAQAIVPTMKRRKYGRIINISSEVVNCSVGNFSAYVAAKGGQNGWTRSMATELAPWRITVNSVSPGWVPVERHADDPQEDKDAYQSTIPLGRWGIPRDVAEAVLYFASTEASFVTGQTLCVNGGRSHTA